MTQTPDLRHVTTWIFDLDETLYGRESGVLAAMEARIEQWLLRQTPGDPASVAAARERMREEYGSTLGALLAQGAHNVDPYLAFVHDVPLDAMKPDPRLRSALARLPGRRLVHTNAPGFHAERVLAALGVADQFQAVFHCAAAGYALKPQAEAFTRIVATHALDPAACAFFEDRSANLAPAAALGMTTVLVGDHAADDPSPHVHFRTADLAGFLSDAHVSEIAA